MSPGFLERLKNYLDERLKGEGPYRYLFKPFEIYSEHGTRALLIQSKPFKVEIPGLFPGEKWAIRTRGEDVIISIEEYLDGNVRVLSYPLGKAGEYISECLLKSYKHRFEKAEAKGKEEEEKVWKAFMRERDEAREDYFNKRNFEKHLKKSYKWVFIGLLWLEEVCKKISKEHGVEIKVEIVDEIECNTFLAARFNGGNMSEEEKMEEIKKRVEAVIVAFKLALNAYPIFPEYPREHREEFQRFRRALLEKVKDLKMHNVKLY
ncbi:MAG: hypothetical protein QXU11_06850 [Thermoproteota archaeon]